MSVVMPDLFRHLSGYVFSMKTGQTPLNCPVGFPKHVWDNGLNFKRLPQCKR